MPIAKFGNRLEFSDLEYQVEFQEYPRTSINGVVTIYNVSGWDDTKARSMFSLKNIQYSIGSPGNLATVKCPYLGVKCVKEYRTCRGVKLCRYVSEDYKNMSHTKVDFGDERNKNIFELNELSIEELTIR
jgi:hypothetical protein